MHARRLWSIVGAVALIAGLAAPASAGRSSSSMPTPTTMSALGDSITIAYDVNRLLAADPAYSWSTGTVSTVKSLYTRLEARDRKAALARTNLAFSGAKVADLAGQAEQVTAGTPEGRELVTVLIGANDACTSTEATMTSAADFGIRVEAGLAELASSGIDQVVVASIPDIYQLWKVGKSSSTARFIWNLYGICQSMLANPSSTSLTDEARRQAVRNRVIEYNAILAQECLDVTSSTTSCRFDGNAVFNTAFTLSDISTIDYFHPSAAGQAKLAAVTYTAFGY